MAIEESHRYDDSSNHVKITREIPLTWLLGFLITLTFWIGNQWMQYNRLLESNQNHGKLLAEIVGKLDNSSNINLKQDYEIENLKQRLTIVENRVGSNR